MGLGRVDLNPLFMTGAGFAGMRCFTDDTLGFIGAKNADAAGVNNFAIKEILGKPLSMDEQLELWDSEYGFSGREVVDKSGFDEGAIKAEIESIEKRIGEVDQETVVIKGRLVKKFKYLSLDQKVSVLFRFIVAFLRSGYSLSFKSFNDIRVGKEASKEVIQKALQAADEEGHKLKSKLTGMKMKAARLVKMTPEERDQTVADWKADQEAAKAEAEAAKAAGAASTEEAQ